MYKTRLPHRKVFVRLSHLILILQMCTPHRWGERRRKVRRHGKVHYVMDPLQLLSKIAHPEAYPVKCSNWRKFVVNTGILRVIDQVLSVIPDGWAQVDCESKKLLCE